MCKSTSSCLSDGKILCSCTWHKTQEISLKQKIELKVYHAAKKLQDFPNLQVLMLTLEYVTFSKNNLIYTE